MRPRHSNYAAVTEIVSCIAKFDAVHNGHHGNKMASDRQHSGRSSSPQRGNDIFSIVAGQGKLHVVAAGFTDGSIGMWGGKSLSLHNQF